MNVVYIPCRGRRIHHFRADYTLIDPFLEGPANTTRRLEAGPYWFMYKDVEGAPINENIARLGWDPVWTGEMVVLRQDGAHFDPMEIFTDHLNLCLSLQERCILECLPENVKGTTIQLMNATSR